MQVKETDLIQNLSEVAIDDVLKSIVDGIVITWAYFRIDHAKGTMQQADPPFPARPLCIGKEGVTIKEDADGPTRAKLHHWLEGPRNTVFTLFRSSKLPGYKRHHRDYRPPESAYALYQEMKRAIAYLDGQKNAL